MTDSELPKIFQSRADFGKNTLVTDESCDLLVGNTRRNLQFIQSLEQAYAVW